MTELSKDLCRMLDAVLQLLKNINLYRYGLFTRPSSENITGNSLSKSIYSDLFCFGI